MISGSTRVVAILGDPVAHSRSPAMHNAAFAALGLDWVYVALRVPPAELRAAITGVRALGIAGLNVTVPHKERIVRWLDDVSTAARQIGAVNTVVRRGQRLVGENTDAPGFLRALAELGFRPRGRRIVLIGAGGSARAAAWAVADAGCARLTILNRTPARAAALAKAVRGLRAGVVRSAALDLESSAEALVDAELVVNCTSIGLDGRIAPPIAVDRTPRDCLFYDLVYGAAPTPFVRLARSRRRRAADGSRMLLHQAALAFELWTGKPAPLTVMEKAYKRR
jgi:shikimate dehydrogenase